ncbi:hypothetical protein F511_06208, partial [Dorcoceras hygrometricum]
TLPSCACARSRAYLDHEQNRCLIQFVMGLNDSCGSIRSQILMMSNLPSVSQAFVIVSQEESHRMALFNQSTNHHTLFIIYQEIRTSQMRELQHRRPHERSLLQSSRIPTRTQALQEVLKENSLRISHEAIKCLLIIRIKSTDKPLPVPHVHAHTI